MAELLTNRLHELARMEISGFPVVSLYLNTEPDGTGRPNHAVFLRKELRDRVATYAERSAERESLDADVVRIEQFVEGELAPSTRGLAIFASTGAALFEALQFDVPFERHGLFINDRPHLVPLARIDDENPRYAAVVVDTNLARIVVFSAGKAIGSDEVRSEKTRQHKAGGWSQARFQRHIAQMHQQHAREVVQRLEEIVQSDRIDHIVIAGDEVIVPLIKQELAEPLTKKVVDVLRLDIRSPEHEILEATLEALKKNDQQSDEAAVQAVVGDFRAGGLGVVGLERVRTALEMGQVHALLLTAAADALKGGSETANELVVKAGQTSAPVRFIQNQELLAPYGGVAASLRFRI